MSQIKTQYYKAGSILANRYCIKKLLGSGGMGLVYLAEDLSNKNKKIALKILHNDLRKEENYEQRFKKEVQLMKSISHPNIVKPYDLYEDESLLLFTMEYVDGLGLEELLDKKIFQLSHLPKLLVDICEGLSVIHSMGIVHRDLKPENIILNRDGIFKITDFGVARTKLSKLTAKNIKVGSTSFMAPELWKGEAPAPTSDLYALGIMLYEMTTGRLPFDHSNPLEIMKMHLEINLPAPSTINPQVQPWVDKLIMDLLEKNPKLRMQSSAQVKNAVIRNFKDLTDCYSSLESQRKELVSLLPLDKLCQEEKLLSTAYKRQPTVILSFSATHNKGEPENSRSRKTVIIPLPRKAAIAFEFEFPTKDFIFLGIFLATLNVYDGILTSIGVDRHGIAAEGNTLLRELMLKYGPDLTLLGMKGVAILIVLMLTIAAKKTKYIKDLIGALSCLYLFAAILPWLYILFVRDHL